MEKNNENRIAPDELVIKSDNQKKAVGSLKNTILLTGSFLKQLADKKEITDNDVKAIDKALSDLAISIQVINIMLATNPTDFKFYKPEEPAIVVPETSKLIIP